MSNPTPSPTISQVLSSLSIAQVWAALGSIIAAASTIVGVSYWAGQTIAEISARDKFTVVSEELTKAQSERIRLEKLAKDYYAYTESLKTQLLQRDEQIALLNENQGKTNTCVYIQKQISALEQRMQSITDGLSIRGSIWSIGPATETRDKEEELRRKQAAEELEKLQQRVIAYSQQLSACAK